MTDSFAIDSMTGQLKTMADLDYEVDEDFLYGDGHRHPMAKMPIDNVDTTTVDDTITVTIMVTDVNEAPMFTTETTTRSVPENTVPNANIGDPGGSDGC